MKINLTPAILSGDIAVVKQQLELVKTQSSFKVLQIDVVDGSFADQQSITPQDLLGLDFADLRLDFHLMTEEPMDYVWELEECGAALPIRTVYGQLERMSYQEAFLEEVKKQNWLAGLAVDLFTPLSSITSEAWDWADALLLLAVEAGTQGQQLQPLIFDKIKESRALIRQNAEPCLVSVDGGVNSQNLAQLKAAGVQEVAVGSALFSAPDFAQAATQLAALC